MKIDRIDLDLPLRIIGALDMSGMDEAVDGVLWRLESSPDGDDVWVRWRRYEVTRKTPAGFRLECDGVSKWLSDATKFVQTKRAALAAFRVRKVRHVKHARRRLEDAELALKWALEWAEEVL